MNNKHSCSCVIESKNLTKTFHNDNVSVHALHQTDLSISRGSVLAITGASGAGKSTLLSLLGGIELPSSGEVLFEGVNLARLDDAGRTRLRRRRIGFVFQAFNLFADMTALENVALPMQLDGVKAREAHPRAMQMLERVGLAEKAARLPPQLSGGEQQRVTIARALVMEPVLILADEPTGSLDSETSSKILNLLTDEVRSLGRTLVVVTHDPSVASWADSAVHVKDGRVYPHGTRDLEVVG